MICVVIGIIYFAFSFLRTLILITTSVFPFWAILLWTVISFIVSFIGVFIPIEDKKISNEKSKTITITFNKETEKLIKEWLEK